MQNIANFMDEQSRVKAWPAKHDLKRQVLEYLATKFELGQFYTEKEVNITLDRWHTFGDYFLLRRSLIEGKYLSRTIDGSRYWRTENSGHPDLVALVEANYALGAVGSIVRLSEGIGSNSYYLAAGRGEFILKDIEQNGMNHPEHEAAILAALRNAGIPVSSIHATKDGDTVLHAQGKSFHLQDFVEGKIYSQADAPEWLLYESAVVLGKIQAAMEHLPPLPTGIGQGFFDPAMRDRAEDRGQSTLALAKERGDDAIVDAVQSRLRMLRALADVRPNLSQMTCQNTHGDYKLGQLIAGKDKINAVIDFTSACTHPICWEVFRSYASADSSCTDGSVNIEHLRRYVGHFLEHGRLNSYDLKMMPYVYYYQNLISDYFRQYYNSEHPNKQTLLADALRSVKQCEWLEQHLTEVEDALTSGF